MIYLFITERGQAERLLGAFPDQEMAQETAQRLISRRPDADQALVDKAVICQRGPEQELIELAVFQRPPPAGF
jgi:hypothetical protein